MKKHVTAFSNALPHFGQIQMARDSDEEMQGGSALLLRLFESDFFDVHLAISYLKTYPGSIGITHYLVNRLRKFNASDVEFYWTQLCYLLITRATNSVALENFVLERCQIDLHVAVVTLWYFQTSLTDLFSQPTSDQFAMCRKILNKVQRIIFEDPPDPTQLLLESAQHVPDLTRAKLSTAKITNVPSVLVGVGLAYSGPAMPRLAASQGPIVIQQGRSTLTQSRERDITESDEESEHANSSGDDSPPPRPRPHRRATTAIDGPKPFADKKTNMSVPALPYSKSTSHVGNHGSPAAPPHHGHSHHKHGNGYGTTHRPSEGPAAHASPASHDKSRVASYVGTPEQGASPHRASGASTPADLSRSSNNTSLGLGLAPSLAQLRKALPKPYLSKVLQLHACRSQLALFRELEDISNRLILVPRAARLSSLRAELTMLNHGLPRGCCLGMHCGGSESGDAAGHTHAHDRIVRISPSESVVLNSADRAPFVIHVEVLVGDLDFDPDRRQNAEDLRIALEEREKQLQRLADRRRQEDERRLSEVVARRAAKAAGSSKTGSSKASSKGKPDHSGKAKPGQSGNSGKSGQGGNYGQGGKAASGHTPHTPSSPQDAALHEAPVSESPPSIASAPEEIDLVEQLYGDISVHDADSYEPVAITTLHNRDVDARTWGVRDVTTPTEPADAARPRPPLPTPSLTLEDYTTRMKMAAVMLSQLDASQAEPRRNVVLATGQAAAGAAGTLVTLPVTLPVGVARAVTQRFADARPSGEHGERGAARARVLAPADADAVRARIVREMAALEAERMEKMRGLSPDDAVVLEAVNKDDPSGAVFRESFAEKRERIRVGSPYGHLAHWDVFSVIVKTGADLRQEQLAVQLIREIGRIWAEERLPHWVRYFRILVTSEATGMIETILDAVSVHSIKKDAHAQQLARAGDAPPTFQAFNLYDHFVETYGPPESARFARAQHAFMVSLASYSVVCYLLQLKDRHNGNILIDTEGHVIHIDFGFLLSNTPGSIGFEMAPFKMTEDYIDILGGINSPKFREFRALFKDLFRGVRKHAERIITLVELMQTDSALPCFQNGPNTSTQLRERFALALTQDQADDFAERLIVSSMNSTFTRLYDLFQGYSNGIL